MSLFNKIANLFLGDNDRVADDKTAQTQIVDPVKQNHDDVALIVRRVVSIVSDNHSVTNCDLYILTDNFENKIRYSSEDFQNGLKSSLAHHNIVFRSIYIDMCSRNDDNISALSDHLYYRIVEKAEVVDYSSISATICAVPDRGSLLEPEIVLDNEGRYNIGIGTNVILDSGNSRTNQIAVSDLPDDPQYDKNCYVSRSHAYITYAHNDGYLLHVELQGTRMMQKRTRILRGNDIIDLNNPNVPQKLHDGDIIELSKSVLLEFKIKDKD